MDVRPLVLALVLALVPCQAAAESARDTLISAAFASFDKTTALARIDQAIKSADATIAANSSDQDARLQRAIAISYRGKLARSRADLIAARRGFEAVVTSDPRNAEAYIALAGWHFGAVIELGPFLARTALGANKATGLQALERSLTLGGDHALFPALACLQRIVLDPKDVATARRLAESALKANASTPLDRLMQRQIATVLPLLRKGDGEAAARTAKLLLPFGRVR